MKLKFNLLFHMIIIFVCTDGATLNTSLKHCKLALSLSSIVAEMSIMHTDRHGFNADEKYTPFVCYILYHIEYIFHFILPATDI